LSWIVPAVQQKVRQLSYASRLLLAWTGLHPVAVLLQLKLQSNWLCSQALADASQRPRAAPWQAQQSRLMLTAPGHCTLCNWQQQPL
jgi:hypothetical protein